MEWAQGRGLLGLPTSPGVILSLPLSCPLPSLEGTWVAGSQDPMCAPHAPNCGVEPQASVSTHPTSISTPRECNTIDQLSRSVVFNSLQLHGLQHTRPVHRQLPELTQTHVH